eukprot:Hpha_TRINITY_DN30518_c0_g1::TRINITY_DN30518_c0_g1_i1::g.193746::m.193746
MLELFAAVAAAVAGAGQRRALFWLVPYPNVTTTEGYKHIWSDWGTLCATQPKGSCLAAASAYALKHNGSLGYASTSAGEANHGLLMEQKGMPALASLGIPTLGMTYFTHYDGIVAVLTDPDPFVKALVKTTLDNGLAGIDLDYEPQALSRAAAAVGGGSAADTLTAFFKKAADGLAAVGKLLTIDVGDCSETVDCSSLATIANLTQVNTMDTFRVGDALGFSRYATKDSPVLKEQWAPGFEPGNMPSLSSWSAVLSAAAARSDPSVRNIATWAIHEYNVGPQPTAYYGAIRTYLETPLA